MFLPSSLPRVRNFWSGKQQAPAMTARGFPTHRSFRGAQISLRPCRAATSCATVMIRRLCRPAIGRYDTGRRYALGLAHPWECQAGGNFKQIGPSCDQAKNMNLEGHQDASLARSHGTVSNTSRRSKELAVTEGQDVTNASVLFDHIGPIARRQRAMGLDRS
jgi:hypothetical protein